MQFKKVLLASMVILMPAQSMAFVEQAQTVAKKVLTFMSDHPYEMTLVGLEAAVVGIFGLLMYRDFQCNIATFDYVHNKIYEFGYWIDRLEKRSLAQYVEKIKTLKSELTQLINCLNVVVDKDFMDEFESLRARVNYQRSLTSSFMHSAFNNSSFNASSFRESSHPFIR